MNWDDNASQWINRLSGNIFVVDELMRWVTLAGPAVLVALIALQWWVKTDREAKRHLAIICGLSTAFALLLNQVILFFYHRPRPYEAGISHLIVERSTDPSFPSDHATVGFAIAASLVLARDRRWFWYLASAIVISFSRVYVGTHYITDVVGGATTGLLGAILINKIYPMLSGITKGIVRIL